MNAPIDKSQAAVAVHKGLYAALAAAQADMGPALKDSVNPAFKSKYADLASVMAACLPALNAHGIAVIQPPYQNEAGAHFVKTVLVHGETGETAECAVPLIVSKNDMQGYGSAVTYARRYGLMSMAGIAPEDDDGNAAAKSPPMVETRRQEPDHRAMFEADVSAAVKGFGRENTLESLKAMFADLYRNNRAVADDPRVIKAKDDRRTALTPVANADLQSDSIPY